MKARGLEAGLVAGLLLMVLGLALMVGGVVVAGLLMPGAYVMGVGMLVAAVAATTLAFNRPSS